MPLQCYHWWLTSPTDQEMWNGGTASLRTKRIPEPMMPPTVCIPLSNYARNTNKTPTYCSLIWSRPLILPTMIYSLLPRDTHWHHSTFAWQFPTQTCIWQEEPSYYWLHCRSTTRW
jgi:hypothetical protein